MTPEMSISNTLFERKRLLVVLCLLLTAGFATVSFVSYVVSRQAIRTAIVDQDLPLTSSNIYSEIQRDLIRPVLISSTMANDTFVRNWVLRGERSVPEIAGYLSEIKLRYGAFSSFFVSDRTGNYYTGDGLLKRVSKDEPRDAWYARVRDMKAPFEINVDPDMANKDALTIFINHRVSDFSGEFIGATGVGLTVESVRNLVNDYEQRYNRTIYFVDGDGRVVIGPAARHQDLSADKGIGPILAKILHDGRGSYQFVRDDDTYLLHVNYLPELKWYLFVEQNEDKALASIRRTLALNLALSLLVTLVVVQLIYLTLRKYHARLEDMAVMDKLTGLYNRHAFSILRTRLLAGQQRSGQPLALLLIDIDLFKQINDRHGHATGDRVLQEVAAVLRRCLRESDVVVRWGGEEFLAALADCPQHEALRIAEVLRGAVAGEAIGGMPVGETTLSVGVAILDAGDIDTAIAAADAALYRAKAEGRNRVVVAEPT
jgi:diguanylate cyclase (GGDEF)-like protein